MKMYDTDDASRRRSGTFFWDITTPQSLPRSEMEVMLAAVMALKAYSRERGGQWWGRMVGLKAEMAV